MIHIFIGLPRSRGMCAGTRGAPRHPLEPFLRHYSYHDDCHIILCYVILYYTILYYTHGLFPIGLISNWVRF